MNGYHRISYLELGPKGDNDKPASEAEKNSNISYTQMSSLDKINSLRIQNIRVAVIIGLLLLIFINANFNIVNQKNIIDCYTDKAHELSHSIYNFFESDLVFTSFVIGLLSVFSDLLFIVACFLWMRKKRANIRFLLSICILYLLDFVFKQLFLIRHKDGVFTSSVPSLLFNFTQGDSFVFSSEIGVLNIIKCEYDKPAVSNEVNTNEDKERRWNAIICGLCRVLMVLISAMKVICRGCFFPSVVIGYFFSGIIFIKADQYVKKMKLDYIRENRRFSSSTI